MKSNEEDSLYDKAHAREYVICYTDGSAELNKSAGAGLFFPNGRYWRLEDKALVVPCNKTNQRAELFAIVVAIMLTDNIPNKLVIKTDSQYSIDTVTNYYERWCSKGYDVLSNVKNLDLIEFIYQKYCSRDIEFKKVKGHSNIVGNIMSDALSRYGSLVDQSLSDTSINIGEYYNKYLRKYNLNMSGSENNLFSLAQNDPKLQQTKEINKETGKAYVKCPLFRLPEDVEYTYMGMSKFLGKVWNSFKLSYLLTNQTSYDNNKLPHILDIIAGYDFIKSNERKMVGRVVGVNILTVGKYDCTILGLWITLLQSMPYYDQGGNPVVGYSLGKKWHLDFSGTYMLNDSDTVRSHFKMRMGQGKFHEWVNSLIGRVAPRSEWDIYKIDTPEMREEVTKISDESDRQFELIKKRLNIF